MKECEIVRLKVREHVANAISTGISQPLSPAIVAGGQVKSGGGASFANLLDLAQSGGNKIGGMLGGAVSARATAAIGIGGEGQQGESGLVDLLASLLDKLTTVSDQIEAGASVSEADLEDLQALVGELEALMSQEGQLPLPGSEGFDALVGLLENLGVSLPEGGTAATSPYEAISAFASRISGSVREQAPGTAGRLTALSQMLDARIAGIETMIAKADPNLAQHQNLLAAENKPNVAAAIAQADPNAGKTIELAAAQQGSNNPNAITDAQMRQANSKSAYEAAQAESEAVRAAKGENADQAVKPAAGHTANDGAKANQQHTPAQQLAAAGAAAGAEQSGDVPDGLTFTVNQAGATQSANATARPETVAYQRPAPQVNLPHIAVEISRHIQNGINRFEIRLNPPELGRIDVRMEMDNSGNVIARLAVEKSETLDLLQRDQRALERALADAGLDQNKTDLEFSLQQGDQQETDDKLPWQAHTARDADTASAEPALAQTHQLYQGYARLDAVNLWV